MSRRIADNVSFSLLPVMSNMPAGVALTGGLGPTGSGFRQHPGGYPFATRSFLKTTSGNGAKPTRPPRMIPERMPRPQVRAPTVLGHEHLPAGHLRRPVR